VVTTVNKESTYLDIVPVGIFVIDTEMKIVSFNAYAEKITGFTESEALSSKCYEVFRAKQCFDACPLRAAMEKKHIDLRARNTILTKDNIEIPIEIAVSVLMDGNANVTGAIECFQEPLPETAQGRFGGKEKEPADASPFQEIIGNDSKIIDIIDILTVAAKTDAKILITGETGTGKDLIARSIHRASARSRGRFIKVNCAAVPGGLLESEFFGYKKGAFTDAKTDKPGRFQLAKGGTIFLDEIGELPLSLQAKLLQVLDEKTFYPLGASRPVVVDVRVISSTNRNIEQMVAEGSFREDLFYRLNVIAIETPSLRERPSDIGVFIDLFLREMYPRHTNGSAMGMLCPDAKDLLLRYSYPGNVRELKHIIEHACIMSQGKPIAREMLPACVFRTQDGKACDDELLQESDLPLIDNEERICILNALRENRWKRQKTAETLSMDRTTLWRKMKRLGLLT